MNAWHDDFIGLELTEVLHSVSCADIDSERAGVSGEFDVVGMIADYEGPAKINLKFHDGFVKKVRFGLDARVIVGAAVRTHVNPGDLYVELSQPG